MSLIMTEQQTSHAARDDVRVLQRKRQQRRSATGWAQEKPAVLGCASHDFASQSFSKVITGDIQH